MVATATELEKLYRSLPVDTGNGQWVHIDIHCYRNNSSTSQAHQTHTAKNEAMKPLIAKIRAQSKKDLHLKKTPTSSQVTVAWPGAEYWPYELGYHPDYLSINVSAITRTFVGKGSPSDIAFTLNLATIFGMVKPDVASVQSYCDAYIGLDCSGFVTNFANIVLNADIDVMNKSATSYRDPANVRRKEIGAIQPFDAMAWAHTNHVAVIDALDMDWLRLVANKRADGSLKGMRVLVVESNGSHGLSDDMYTIQSVDSHGVFSVKRSYQETVWKVYIRPLP
jgi:hypothetical protein